TKPRNNALHAFCGIETITPAAYAAATKRVFLHHAPLPRAKITEIFYNSEAQGTSPSFKPQSIIL
ncbi:MAG: hypothetical protein SPK18_04880, partial [Treponema sp.]|nr:hypothetical protein [Spirochaetia bacterium]MDD7534867.1 hypothetical protein [Treponema sp.]MDY5757896.1 hypothetical protein [Treponema sp.]